MRKILLAIAGIAAMLVPSPSFAARSALEVATIKAASDCVAAAALKHPRVIVLYQQNRLKEITDWIVLTSHACDNQLTAMQLLHDRLYGAGRGRNFLLGDYLADLPRAVSERIGVEIARRMAEEGKTDDIAGYDAQTKENKAITAARWFEQCNDVDIAKSLPKRSTPLSVMNFGYCLGFTLAVADTLQFISTNSPGQIETCIPKGTPTLDLIEVGQKFVKDNPKYRHLLAANVLVGAFKDAFGCEGW